MSKLEEIIKKANEYGIHVDYESNGDKGWYFTLSRKGYHLTHGEYKNMYFDFYEFEHFVKNNDINSLDKEHNSKLKYIYG